jgi:hypothetical protein
VSLYKVFLKSKNEGNEGESNASAGGNHDNRCIGPFLALRVYVKMSEINEAGGV